MRNHNKKIETQGTFQQALTKALLLHGALLMVLIIRVAFPSKPMPTALAIAPAVTEQPVIQAKTIDGKALEMEVARQAKAEADKKAKQQADREALLAEQQKLKAQKAALEKARADEEKRLAAVQAEKKKAEQALKAQQAAAAKAAAEKAAEQKRLAEAKAKAAKEKQLADAKAAQESAKKAAREAELAKALAAEKAAADAALSGAQLREIDRYKLMVQQQIMRHWFIQGAPRAEQTTQLLVKLAPNGNVLAVTMARSSGNEALDRSAVAAVYKASPLPVPEDPRLFTSFRELRLTLRPDAIISAGG